MVAVPDETTPKSSRTSAPVVGISTGVLAGTGSPVDAVTPEPPTKAAALEQTHSRYFTGEELAWRNRD
jgi:hypothetical protein